MPHWSVSKTLLKKQKAMKTYLTSIFFFIPLICQGVDYHSLADAVAVAESNNDSQAVGDSGKARGAYQMWEIAWKQVNTLRAKEKRYRYPWSYAHDRFVSKQYAIDYLRWCGWVLEKHLGRKPTYWEVYAAYARGPSCFIEEHDCRYSSLPKRTHRAISVIASQLKETLPR